MSTNATMTPVQIEANRARARAWRARPGNKEREIEAKRRRRQADPERWAEQKRASSARYAEKNRERINLRNNETRARLRAEVINAYGGRCSCPGCHVHHAELLTVDHVNGGASHRQNRRSSRDIYAQIKRMGFPPEFQLLCGSCNLANSDQDACPLSGADH